MILNEFVEPPQVSAVGPHSQVLRSQDCPLLCLAWFLHLHAHPRVHRRLLLFLVRRVHHQPTHAQVRTTVAHLEYSPYIMSPYFDVTVDCRSPGLIAI